MKNMIAMLLLALPVAAHAQAGLEKAEKGQFYVFAGRFTPAHNDQLVNPSGQGAFGLGGGGRFSPHFSWDIDLLFADQHVNTPAGFVPPNQFLVSQSGRADIDTWGLGGVVKGTLPVGGWLDLYAGAGLGWYKSTLTVHRTRIVSIFLPIPQSEDIERTDRGLGVQWLAGADLKFGDRWRLGFQWRRFDFKAQFGKEVPGEVNVGGNLGLLYSRWVF